MSYSISASGHDATGNDEALLAKLRDFFKDLLDNHGLQSVSVYHNAGTIQTADLTPTTPPEIPAADTTPQGPVPEPEQPVDAPAPALEFDPAMEPTEPAPEAPATPYDPATGETTA